MTLSDRVSTHRGAASAPRPVPPPGRHGAPANARPAVPPAPAWHRIGQALAAATLCLAAAHATALTLVSIDRETVNMRAGAGTNHAVQWQLSRGYPLRVLAHRRGWMQVQDFEGDRGWVLAQLTGRKPHTVVKVDRANLRSAPSTRAKVVGQLGYGEVLRTLERRSGWLRVRDTTGRTGWVARRLLWGW